MGGSGNTAEMLHRVELSSADGGASCVLMVTGGSRGAVDAQ